MKKNLIKTLIIIPLLLLVGCKPSQPPMDSEANIGFYYINDTHGAFKRQNTDANYNEAGMAYISSYLKEKKTQNASNNPIILSGGDMFQGGFESNITYGEIMVDAMNEIGFDAMVLGNHEFDWGEEKLVSIIEKLNCPVISCNTLYRETNERPEYLEPYTIIERNNLKIGIIGAAEEGMGSSITGSISKNFSFPNPIPYIKSYSYELRTEKECDLVIAAFHDGGFNGSTYKFGSLCEIDYRTQLGYVDGIFLAHDHRYKSGNYLGVPYLESGCNGRYVGYMGLSLKRNEANKFVVNGFQVENTNAYRTCTIEDSKVSNLLTVYADAIEQGDKVVYTFKHSYSRDEFARIICEAMYWYICEYNDFFDNQEIYFVSHNPGGVRAEVESGPMTLSKLYTVTPFDNNVYIQKCTEDNLQYMRNQTSSYITYECDEIIYEDGFTHAATISYLAENETYSRYIQVEAKQYEITAKQILIEYLENNINENL